MMPVMDVKKESVKVFENLGLNAFSNLAVVSTAIDGVSCDAIASINTDGGGYIITPLAIIVNEEVFARLSNPGEDLN